MNDACPTPAMGAGAQKAHHEAYDKCRGHLSLSGTSLCLDVCSEVPGEGATTVEVILSYKMPAYKAGERRLYLGAWKHGISLYGSQADRDGGFSVRHPGLVTSKGTVQLQLEETAAIPDEEFLRLARAALSPEPPQMARPGRTRRRC